MNNSITAQCVEDKKQHLAGGARKCTTLSKETVEQRFYREHRRCSFYSLAHRAGQRELFQIPERWYNAAPYCDWCPNQARYVSVVLETFWCDWCLKRGYGRDDILCQEEVS